MPLLTVDEAAQQLKCKPCTIRRHMHEWGAYVRVGRLVRIDPDKLPKAGATVQNSPTKPKPLTAWEKEVYGYESA